MRTLEHVLIVDDDHVNNFICENIILKTGFSKNVTSFSNAEDSLIYLRKLQSESENPPDLIFLDINMPDINGWAYLEEFKKLKGSKTGEIPIIMLSSSIYKDDKSRSLSYDSVVDFVSKPISKTVLENISNSHFANMA
jgi:CheY-like chemotaxis protein